MRDGEEEEEKEEDSEDRERWVIHARALEGHTRTLASGCVPFVMPLLSCVLGQANYSCSRWRVHSPNDPPGEVLLIRSYPLVGE